MRYEVRRNGRLLSAHPTKGAATKAAKAGDKSGKTDVIDTQAADKAKK